MKSSRFIMLLAGMPFAQAEIGPLPDTAAPASVVAPAPVARETLHPSVSDTAKVRILPAPAASGSPRKEKSVAYAEGENWQVTLDFADIAESGETNTRHFHQKEHQSNSCCLDLAWYPVNGGQGRLRAGGFANLGGWNQKLTDGSSVLLADLTVGGSFLGAIPLGNIWGVWARTDLGVSNLVIERHITGMDWGLGWAIRAGFSGRPWGSTLFVGAGMDWRTYLNVDLKAIPATTLLLGGWL